jgi:hypothetical protein
VSEVPAVREEPPPLVTAVEGAPVWERLANESRTAFKNFTVYRDQTRGRHSITRAADDLGKNRGTLTEQSVKYSWQRRVDAYEDYLERRDRELLENERDELNRQGARLGRAMVAMSTARLIGGRFQGREISAANMNDANPVEAARIGEVGWKMARLATGQPTDAVKGLVLVTTEDHVRIVNDLFQIGMHVLPEELRSRYSMLWNTYLDSGRLPF